MTSEFNRRPLQIATTALVSVWFLVMVRFGSGDFFYTGDRVLGLAPVQQAIVAPLLLFFLLYGSLRPFAEFVRTANLTFLVALQGVRILALSHLVSWGYGLMAGGFAWPVALGNLFVCVLALSTVTAVAERRGRWVMRSYLLTILGILEFLMTIALAVLGYFTAPLAIDPAIAPGGYVSFTTTPLSLFPTFAIPFLLVMHCTTLIALRSQARA